MQKLGMDTQKTQHLQQLREDYVNLTIQNLLLQLTVRKQERINKKEKKKMKKLVECLYEIK